MLWPVCDKCGAAVSPQDGVIAIGKVEMEVAETEWRAWELAHQGEPLSLQEMLAGPESAKWQWGHQACIPNDGGYSIDPDTFNSLGKALDITLHMMEKTWVQYSDWINFVRRIHDVPR